MDGPDNIRNNIEVLFLGTSGAIRTPIFPSHCSACVEAAKTPRARRLRSTLGIFGQESLIIDCGPDMGQIITQYDISSISRVFITHWHADHVFGIGELDLYAILTSIQNIPIYMDEKICDEFENVFGYAKRLKVIPFNVTDKIVTPDVTIVPLSANHETPTVGFFIAPNNGSQTLAYFPDTQSLPSETVAYLKDEVDIFVIDGTWGDSYPTKNGIPIPRGHMTIADAAHEAYRIKSRRTIITHFGTHTFRDGTLIPQPLKVLEEEADRHGVELAFDGLRIIL